MSKNGKTAKSLASVHLESHKHSSDELSSNTVHLLQNFLNPILSFHPQSMFVVGTLICDVIWVDLLRLIISKTNGKSQFSFISNAHIDFDQLCNTKSCSIVLKLVYFRFVQTRVLLP